MCRVSRPQCSIHPAQLSRIEVGKNIEAGIKVERGATRGIFGPSVGREGRRGQEVDDLEAPIGECVALSKFEGRPGGDDVCVP